MTTLCGLLLVVAACWGLAPLLLAVHELWANEYGAFSHGYLVLAMSVWLSVDALREQPPPRLQPSWRAAAALLALVLALIGMDLMFINSGRMVLLPWLALAAIALVFGVTLARRLLLPIAFIYMALPQWWVINTPLQTLTTLANNALIRVTQLPAYVDGNFVFVPSGTFEIASGCSGLNYLIAALSLAGFYALHRLRSWQHRTSLMVFAAVSALIANWLRVYALIVVGIVTDMQHYLIRVDHLYFGWVLFMVLMVPTFLLGRRFENAEADAQARVAEDPARNESAPMAVAGRAMLVAACAAVAILLLPRLLTAQDASIDEPAPDAQADSNPEAVQSAWNPVFIGAQVERRTVSGPPGPLEVYVARYAHQTSERRLVRAQNEFFGPDWRLIERSPRSVGTPNGELTVEESRGVLQGRPRLIWSWYSVAGRSANTKLGAKIAEVRGLLGGRRDAAALALSAECEQEDCGNARSRLEAYLLRADGALLNPG